MPDTPWAVFPEDDHLEPGDKGLVQRGAGGVRFDATLVAYKGADGNYHVGTLEVNSPAAASTFYNDSFSFRNAADSADAAVTVGGFNANGNVVLGDSVADTISFFGQPVNSLGFQVVSSNPVLFVDAGDYLEYNRATNTWNFGVGGSSRVTVSSTALVALGDFAVNGNSILGNASGDATTIRGILTLTEGNLKFPATQVPSADPNTLDDYEEGTFTPTLAFGGASVGITYAFRSGRYTKVGRTVFIEVDFTLTSKGSSAGNATIAGLPFTAVAGLNGGQMAWFLYDTPGPIGAFMAQVTAGGSVVDLFNWTANAFYFTTNTHLINTSVIRVSGTYTV